MIRRTFLSSCAAAATGAVLLKNTAAHAALPTDKPFAKIKLNMSAPLDWFPGEQPEQRIEAAAAWGLRAYEWLGPEGDFKAMRAMADKHDMELSCIVGAGAIAAGGMVNPDDHDKIVEQFKVRVEMAKALNCKRLIALSGNTRDDISHAEQTKHVITCLKRLAPIAEKNGRIIVLEALNTLVNHAGYFVARTDHSMEIVEGVDSPNVKMLFDIYHQQITEGNVIRNFSKNVKNIGHFHVADNPGRKEPGTGELNYAMIFKAIEKTKFKGFVALECGHSTKDYEKTLRATLDLLNQG
jgi:hydroxypyruvate isomerase